MIKINYPLLYYQLQEDAVLGILVGADYQMVEKDLKRLKTTLSDFITRQYKKEDFYPYMDILEPRLKVIEVKIRPAYKEKTGRYPMKDMLSVPVALVYGETENGYYECYLPAFNESFYYYEPKQFKSLANHFAADLLNQLSPEQLHRHLMRQKPQLDQITLRINEDRKYKQKEPDFAQRRIETLSRLAIPYPYPKSFKKKGNIFPEAAWEMEEIVVDIIDKLINNRANVLVVGKHGVGKSAALMQAIRKIQGSGLNIKMNFWQLMPQRITASSKYLGEWEETCENMLEELHADSGILWILDMVRLMQIGGTGAEDSVAAFMMSFLQRGILKMVGEVTEQELESMRRLLPGFVENFQIVKVEEMPETKIHAIMDRFAEFSSQNLKVKLHQDGLSLAYRLLLRYYPYESFPGKIIKLIGQCVNEAKINKTGAVAKEQVIDVFVKQTGLPELFLRDDLMLDSQELKQYFNSNIIGQDAAVDKLCSIVKVFKAGLNNPYKPIQTLLFAGPTGVGKTASAKCLANYFFGKGQKQFPLIRIDMSEFQHPSQITRFIGAGREVGKLVQDIRDRPFSVLLLDEVEKADPSIFDALMTVLDEGLLVDAFGRVVNFRNTIIIMTTNLGASNRQSIGFAKMEDDEAAYFSAINNFFRPEFVNRIDGVVFFNSLGTEDIRQICLKELRELNEREGFAKRKLNLTFSNRVIDRLSSVGFDERYGARPLQRAIEQQIVSPLANWLLKNSKVNKKLLEVDFVEQKITVTVKSPG
ncbi:MAG: AAA family ATPase [Bacteroidota bacterium]